MQKIVLKYLMCLIYLVIIVKYRLCRFGKPFVIDMMEVDMFETVSDRFDEIKKGLMNDIMDRSILQEDK